WPAALAAWCGGRRAAWGGAGGGRATGARSPRSTRRALSCWPTESSGDEADEPARACHGGRQPPARRPRALRGVATLSERRSLARRARPGDTPVSPALRFGLPEDHAARRLCRRGLGMRRGRRCARGWAPGVRELRGPRGGGLAEDPRARSRVGARLRRGARDDHPARLRSPDRRCARRADAVLSAVAGAEA